MLSNRLFIFSFLICALFLAGCQKAPEIQRVEIGSAATIRLPASWRTEPGTVTRLLARPTEQGRTVAGAFFLVAVDQVQAGHPATLDGYVEFKEVQAAAGAKRHELLDRRRLLLDARPAEMRLRFWANGHEERRVLSYLVVVDGQGWILTGSALAADFPRLEADFRRAAESIVWRAPEPPAAAQ